MYDNNDVVYSLFIPEQATESPRPHLTAQGKGLLIFILYLDLIRLSLTQGTPSAACPPESLSGINNPSFWRSSDSKEWLPLVRALQQAAETQSIPAGSLTPAFKLPLPDYDSGGLVDALKHAFRENVSKASAALGEHEDKVSQCLMYLNDFVDQEKRATHLPAIMRSLFTSIHEKIQVNQISTETTPLHQKAMEAEAAVCCLYVLFSIHRLISVLPVDRAGGCSPDTAFQQSV